MEFGDRWLLQKLKSFRFPCSGALYYFSDDEEVSSSFVAITNSTIANNRANLTGGAIFSKTLHILAISCMEKMRADDELDVSNPSEHRPGVRSIERPEENITVGQPNPATPPGRGIQQDLKREGMWWQPSPRL